MVLLASNDDGIIADGVGFHLALCPPALEMEMSSTAPCVYDTLFASTDRRTAIGGDRFRFSANRGAKQAQC